MSSPQSFADDMKGLLGATPFWLGPSQPTIPVNQLADPAKPAYVIGDGESSFFGAAKAALSALDPFNGSGTVSANIAQATVPVGKSAAKALDAGADSLKSAGGGIASGFKWFTFLLLLGAAGYAYLMVAPFIPKPSGAR